jgi:hypothetical protein
MKVILAALALWAGAAAHLTEPASAHWPSGTNGAAAAKATAMPTGAQPTASVSNRSVTVSWSQSTIAGGPAVGGYVVKRYSTGGALQSIGSGCSGTISALSCTEDSVPSGSWRYAVVPKHQNWLGVEGVQSATVTVASASLSLSAPTTITSLPSTLTGSIAGFIPGQTVTYRLDNATSGTVLTGSINPTPVPSSGNATVSVTIPTDTTNGSHTVYAIGSSGDVASASFTVNVPVATTIATSAWDIRDASDGSEGNSTWQMATAADSRTLPTGAWTSSFGTRYIEFDMNDPLPSGLTVSDAAFNFRFAAAGGGEIACFYFELRRISTDEVISTHGSTSSPVQCVTGTTYQTVSTTLPQLTTSALANDVRIRVYARESASKLINLDLATVTGSAASTAFTLQAIRYQDATATASTTRWGPATSADNFNFPTSGNWANSFSTSRWVKFNFPAHVPSGATVTGATFENQYRPTTLPRTACWYAEVYAGTTLIKTAGSTASPISCNSTSTYTTDSVSIPEVNTPARANSLSVRIYYSVTGSGTRTTQHDLVRLSVTYSQ